MGERKRIGHIGFSDGKMARVTLQNNLWSSSSFCLLSYHLLNISPSLFSASMMEYSFVS